MGAILASAIISRVEADLQDSDNVHWTEADHLAALNDGQRAVLLLKPDAYVKTVSIALVTGTKQTIPADGIALVGAIRNMGTGGTTPGRAIRFIPKDDLDLINPNWHSATADAVAKHYTYDESNRKVFYVYPPQPAISPGYIEVAHSAVPADVSAVGNAITLGDEYTEPLYLFMMARAHSKETEAAQTQRVAGYYTMFVQSLGLHGREVKSIVDNLINNDEGQ